MINQLLYIQPIFLNKILKSPLFTGGKSFLSDLTFAVIIVSGAITVLCIIFELLVSQINSLEEWGKHSKKVRKVAIIGVIIFLVSGFYKLVVEGYFGFNLDTGKALDTAISLINYYL